MNIYQIDAAIAGLIDPETGEIMDYEAFESLAMARNDKIENAAMLLKNKLAFSAEIGKEIAALQKRKKVADNNVKRLKEYIAMALGGETFESTRCTISYRKSEETEIDVEFIEWAMENCPDVVIAQSPTVDKTELKKLLKGGMECEFARVVEKQNIQIK